MPPAIEPRILKGFRDYPPALMIPRERVLNAARTVYRRFGFAPIDTPALEYAEVLLGKAGGETERQVYRFRDQGDRDVALRFDLTVPFARFAALHVKTAGVPFKRYAMGPVWRGENPTAGRFREFWQSDFDTIGTTSNSADAEVVVVIDALMRELGVTSFKVRVNNRKLLSGLLESCGVSEQAPAVLGALDKLTKIGRDAVIAELVRVGVDQTQAGRLLSLAATDGSNHDRLARAETEFGTNANGAEGIANLRELLTICEAAGVPESRLQLDFSIARGLDYYTGTIYETFLDELPSIGSVCSGGRYDNLAGLYTNQILPGVGASLGVDRLLAAMQELGHPWLDSGRATTADVLVTQFDASRVADYHALANRLRAAGLAVEVYPEAKKLKAQLEYADKRGHRFAVIAGSQEFAAGVWQVKELATQQQASLPADEIAAHIGAAS